MSDEGALVWSDEKGDLRKSKEVEKELPVDPSQVLLEVRRLTSGKGRTVLEVTGLPKNKSWCKKLAKEIKKSLATGGCYKNSKIEIHGENLDNLLVFFDKLSLKWKKRGG